MIKGYSLVQDLKSLINNPKYSDIEILCEDKKILYGSRSILAARSEVFEGLFYNGMKETYEKQVSFPTINSSVMEIILEYIYTGSIKDEYLTKDNIIEVFQAADYFQLENIKNFITKIIISILERNYTKNYLPELLTKIVNNTILSGDSHILLDLLVKAVAIMPLNKIEFDQLSIAAFKTILLYKYEENGPFMTSEYEVLRYGAILAAQQVSDDAFNTLMELLPKLEEIKDSNWKENEIITNHQKISEELEPLIEFIDFDKIDAEILSDIIEPLNIIPTEIFLNTYRRRARLNIAEIQETSHNFIDYVWDETVCGSKITVEENGKVANTKIDCKFQDIKSKVIFEDKGIFEWDVIIEGTNFYCVGLCTPLESNFVYEITKSLANKWILCSDGNCYDNSDYRREMSYCIPFKSSTIVTVHLDMSVKACAFTVNGIKYPTVKLWNDLPSRLCPLVILSYPGRARIQLHLQNFFTEFLF
ncbi:hypothetical protein GLOIN_2v1847831 [Rhizophagus clarus]|uniref:BTB domain-containing protein n=1 Tax=Rhizophagus clarus TaxID=94130 RepID=A0A8H3R500_9GLOM|nr:hypothetical protein GLOIN_2v1847831 [Rhizophagus clarus]